MAKTDQLRQRKKGESAQEQKEEGASPKFQSHAKEDAALKKEEEPESKPFNPQGLTVLGRIAVFLGFPLGVGLVSLYLSYMRNFRKGDKEIDLDRDFVFPFLLSLSTVIVVGFQTKGFTTTKVKPLVSWPKVKRKRKIIHQTVVVDDDQITGEESAKAKDEVAKKDD
eukprot:CAMPEP_0195294922 /NCGR_PEP_ID=MMETSP0707-20130614/16206_1 /TAXON_ID=33640 /ORGANISM="Asterionellopsis glacialis, Strain CCMP134" /LENGTH=166 /DNA_ID=CAMNT_0040356013 /DNA_START=117 /DNA_END=617 /DNA_ORIENTATION=-